MFKWRTRFEKTLEEKTGKNFQIFLETMIEIFKDYSYSIDQSSGTIEMLAMDHPVYNFRLVNKAKDRAIISCYLPLSQSAMVYVESSQSSFSLKDFLELKFGIKRPANEIYQNNEKYYAYQLEMIRKSLEDQEFNDVIQGKIWKKWLRPMDWGDYK